jgi:tetratricopeptide (TPR) repeat protein
MEWLLAALQRARERFGTSDEYPLIDDGEILDQEVIYESWPWEYVQPAKHNHDALMEAALTNDHADLPARFVWLNLFYRLAHYPADDVAVDVADRDNAAGRREEFLSDLKTLVGLTREEVCDCRDPRRIRWEISNACAVQDWSLAGTLYKRLEDLAEADQAAQVLATHGRHEVLTVFAQHWDLAGLGLSLWAPIPEKRFAAVADLLLSLRSLGAAEDPVISLSPDEENRIEDARHHLAKAMKSKVKADLVYRFLLLRCRLALGAFREAASDCEALLRRRDEFAGGRWKAMDFEPFAVSRLFALAIDSYEADGQVDRAITASERWVKEFPDQPGINERRFRLFQKQGDLDSAHESLRKEVAIDSARGDDPAVSMALRIGELYAAPDVQWRRFRRNLDPNEIELVQSLVTILWKNSGRFGDRSFKEWIDGCYLLLRRLPDNPAMAVFAFGRLAETELHTRIFERFRETMRLEAPSIPSTEKDPLTNYVYVRGGVMTLEQMLNEIRHREARSMAGGRFRDWFGPEKNAGLLQQVDLKRLGELNNRAKHSREPHLEWKDAEEMARLTRELLDVLLSM